MKLRDSTFNEKESARNLGGSKGDTGRDEALLGGIQKGHLSGEGTKEGSGRAKKIGKH